MSASELHSVGKSKGEAKINRKYRKKTLKVLLYKIKVLYLYCQKEQEYKLKVKNYDIARKILSV